MYIVLVLFYRGPMLCKITVFVLLLFVDPVFVYCLRLFLICGSSICILSSSFSYRGPMLCVVIVFVLFLFVDRVFVYCLCPSLILDPVFVYCLRPSLIVDLVFVYCLSVSVATGPNSIHPNPRSSLCYYECSLCIFSFDCCCSLLYGAILRSRADSLRLHVILHE